MKMTDETRRMKEVVGPWLREHGFVWNIDANPATLLALYDDAYQQGALDMRERCAKACEEYTLSPFWRASVRDLDLAAACRALTVGET